MKKQPHFDANSKAWIISLIVMIIVTLAVIFGSNAIYNQVNGNSTEVEPAALSVIAANIN